MFTESLLESESGMWRGQRWATLVSIVLQGAVLAVAVVLPLMYPQMLQVDPKIVHYIPTPLLPAPATARAEEGGRSAGAPRATPEFREPTTIPSRVRDGEDVPPPGEVSAAAEHLAAGRDSTGILDNLFARMERAVRVEVKRPERVRVSVIEMGALTHKVTPVYPRPALLIRQQGDVVLSAVIGRDGTIQSLQVRSGPPLLTGAALEAVRQWRYRPYVLNGEAVEVETQITVRFRLAAP